MEVERAVRRLGSIWNDAATASSVTNWERPGTHGPWSLCRESSLLAPWFQLSETHFGLWPLEV